MVTMVSLTTNLKKTYLKTHYAIKHTKILRYRCHHTVNGKGLERTCSVGAGQPNDQPAGKWRQFAGFWCAWRNESSVALKKASVKSENEFCSRRQTRKDGASGWCTPDTFAQSCQWRIKISRQRYRVGRVMSNVSQGAG